MGMPIALLLTLLVLWVCPLPLSALKQFFVLTVCEFVCVLLSSSNPPLIHNE